MEKQRVRAFLRIFKGRHMAVGGAVVIVMLFLISAFASLLAPYDPGKTDVSLKLKPPSSRNVVGTDQLGRDIFSRMLHGSRISLSVGFVAVAISIFIGILVGAVAGYYGRWVDTILMRFVDTMLCFPSFFLILTIVALLGPKILNIMIVIGITSWMGTARFVRAEFLSLRERDYVQAAKALGARDLRIMLRHLLPNALAPVFVAATLKVASAILIEAGLSFLGFGVQPPAPSWGNILTEGRTYIFDAWWLTVFPGIAILITVLSFNLLGEGLRDALDPRLRGRR
jgi:peptide/nickel transport system permease protein